MNWLRLWHDMPTDPKWRTIARVSGHRISEVISVYVHLLANASANADERGRTQNWNNEDVASALDMDESQISDILSAMQGRVLDGDLLTGWDKRQPKREDNASERAKEWRERKRTQANATSDEPNAGKRPDTEKRREEKKDQSLSAPPKAGSATTHGSRLTITDLPDDWHNWVTANAPDGLGWGSERAGDVFEKFRDYWIAQAGAKGRKADWLATWRNWCRKEDADLKAAQKRNGGAARRPAANANLPRLPLLSDAESQRLLNEADEMLRREL